MDNEKIAVSELSLLVSKTNRLQSFITDGDREPHWDGYIHVFSGSEKKATQSVGRVPVQVKSITSKRFRAKNPTFKARITDLKQYLEEGGVIYVVGVISPPITCKLFYQTLLPFDLTLLLKNVEENQQWKIISLDVLPTDPDTLENLFYSFLKNRRMQLPVISEPDTHSPIDYKTMQKPPLSDLIVGNLGINKNFIKPGTVLPLPCYLYESYEDGRKVPVAKAEFKLTGVRKLYNKPITCGDKTFYESFTEIDRESNRTLQIGTCFCYIIPEVNYGGNCYAFFESTGTLQERLHGANFMLAALQNRGFMAGDTFWELHYSHDEEVSKYKKVEDFARLMRDVDSGLKTAGFTGDLDLDNISADAWSSIEIFAKNIQSGKPIPMALSSLPAEETIEDQFISILSCGPLQLALLCRPAHKDHYYCENLFHTRPEVDIDGTQTPVFPYLLIDPQKLPYTDNLNYQELINSFDEIAHNSFSEDKVNSLLLALLMAYDKTGRQEQLQAADRISSWLLESHEKASDPVNLLNRYQTILRQRELHDDEIERIFELIENPSVQESIKIGAYILLGNASAVKVGLKRLSENERKEFESTPIYSLFTTTQHTTSDNTGLTIEK